MVDEVSRQPPLKDEIIYYITILVALITVTAINKITIIIISISKKNVKVDTSAHYQWAEKLEIGLKIYGPHFAESL